MERVTPKAFRSVLLSSFLTLALSEIAKFINLGGLENPLALSLLKIIIFLVIFVIFYVDKGVDLQMLKSVLELVRKLVDKIQNLKEVLKNNGQ